MRVSFELDAAAVTTAALAGFLGLVALHAAYPGLFDYWPKGSSDLASWVQAIGAIASIVYAGHLLRKQFSHAENMHQVQIRESQRIKRADELKADLDIVRACHALAIHCELAMATLYRKVANIDPYGRHPATTMERLDSLERTIELMISKAVPPAAMLAMLELGDIVAFAKTATRDLPADFKARSDCLEADLARGRFDQVSEQRAHLEEFESSLASEVQREGHPRVG